MHVWIHIFLGSNLQSPLSHHHLWGSIIVSHHFANFIFADICPLSPKPLQGSTDRRLFGEPLIQEYVINTLLVSKALTYIFANHKSKTAFQKRVNAPWLANVSHKRFKTQRSTKVGHNHFNTQRLTKVGHKIIINHKGSRKWTTQNVVKSKGSTKVGLKYTKSGPQKHFKTHRLMKVDLERFV